VIFSCPLAFGAPVRGGGLRRNIAIRLVWKTRIVRLPDDEKISKISLFILAQFTNVTDRQTDTA